MGFRDAMERKMKIISPTRRDLAALGEKYCWSLTPGAEDIVRLLHKLGKQVWLLTGNFQPAVGILAKKAGGACDQNSCNEVYFDSLGNYAGFNSGNKLSETMEKQRLLRNYLPIKRKSPLLAIASPIWKLKNMSGCLLIWRSCRKEDGQENADYYIGEPDLSPVLSLVLTRAEKSY